VQRELLSVGTHFQGRVTKKGTAGLLTPISHANRLHSGTRLGDKTKACSHAAGNKVATRSAVDQDANRKIFQKSLDDEQRRVDQRGLNRLVPQRHRGFTWVVLPCLKRREVFILLIASQIWHVDVVIGIQA